MMLMEIPVSWTRRRDLKKLILLVICLVLQTQISQQKSIPSSMQTYLLKFGYLPQSGFEIRDQVSEAGMKNALRNLQSFAKINASGEFDSATKELLIRPRCGVPDILTGQFMSKTQRKKRRKKRFLIQGQKWPRTSLTWSLINSAATHSSTDVIRELSYALNLWSKSSPLRFSQLPGDKASEADIRVIFQRGKHDDGYPFDGKGSILAHAFFPGTGQGGDAHFDDDETWTVDDSSNIEGTRLFAVAAHEFGHSLGLSHSDVEGSLMYPWYQKFGYEFTLHQDDERGIQGIYGTTTKFAKNPYNTRPPVERPKEDPREVGPTLPRAGPNRCDTSYDAISYIRTELFVFKGPFFWRLNDNQLLKGYPSRIREMWPQLPVGLDHVDAVYEHQDEIVFFIGKKYWRFKDGIELRPNFPKSIGTIGIRADKIDGAMIWGHNGKTYLFSGSKYWRLRDDGGDDFRIEPDYPRDMYVWKGVPPDIDAVLRWKDNNVYFFKGKVFWKFDDKHMKVESEIPSLSAPHWMGCSSSPLTPTTTNGTITPSSSASSLHSIKSINLLLLMLIIPSLSLFNQLFILKT